MYIAETSLIRLAQKHALWLLVIFLGLVTGLAVVNNYFVEPNYTFAYMAKGRSQADIVKELDVAIAFHQQRSLASPKDGLELASLAASYFKKARVLGQADYYLLAEQTARRSLDNLTYFNSGALLVLADIAEARHDFREAVRLAETVLASKAGNESALSILISSQLATGQLDKAAQAANLLSKQVPSAGSLGYRALVELAQGKLDKARQSLTTALTLSSSADPYAAAWLWVQAGNLELGSGHYAEAESFYKGALQIVKDYPLAELQLASAELLQGRYRQAEKRFSGVLAQSSTALTVFDHVALQGIARAKLLRGNRKAAQTIWAEAEQILRKDSSQNAFGHKRELASLLLERGYPQDLPEALSLLQAESLNRRDAKTLDLLAWALERSGYLEEAFAVSQEAISVGSSRPEVLFRASYLAEQLGLANAGELRQKALTLNPDFNETTWQALGLIGGEGL